MKCALFVCNRSQMTQAFFERYAPDEIRAESAGSDPARQVWPEVVAWSIPDRAGRPVEEVRAIRDAIEANVRELAETKLDAIRSDRTAHQTRECLKRDTCDVLAVMA